MNLCDCWGHCRCQESRRSSSFLRTGEEVEVFIEGGARYGGVFVSEDDDGNVTIRQGNRHRRIAGRLILSISW